MVLRSAPALFYCACALLPGRQRLDVDEEPEPVSAADLRDVGRLAAPAGAGVPVRFLGSKPTGASV